MATRTATQYRVRFNTDPAGPLLGVEQNIDVAMPPQFNIAQALQRIMRDVLTPQDTVTAIEITGRPVFTNDDL